MPYALAILDEAVVQLQAMLDSVPSDRRDAIVEEIDRRLVELADATNAAQRPRGIILSLPLLVDSTLYRWQAAWYYDQDEKRIVIARFGRDPRMIL